MSTALIVIDIQNDYFDTGSMTLVGADAACENAKRLIDRFHTEGSPVIYIQHIATRPSATFFLPGTVGAEIHPMLSPQEGDMLIVKHYPNSFRDTCLFEYLQNKQIADLIVCGMMTHMCVDATVRAAKDFGYTVTVIGDACATKDLEINGTLVRAENVQNSFLAALNYFYSSVKTTREYLGF